jgi:hypothetical protein
MNKVVNIPIRFATGNTKILGKITRAA